MQILQKQDLDGKTRKRRPKTVSGGKKSLMAYDVSGGKGLSEKVANGLCCVREEKG